MDRRFRWKSVCRARQAVHDDNCEWESSLCFAPHWLFHSNTSMNKLMGKSSLLVIQECSRTTRVRNMWITWYRYVLLFSPFRECLGLQIYKISYSVYIFFLYRQNDSSGCNSDAEEVSGSKGMIKIVADITLFKEFQATFIGIISRKKYLKKDAGRFQSACTNHVLPVRLFQSQRSVQRYSSWVFYPETTIVFVNSGLRGGGEARARSASVECSDRKPCTNRTALVVSVPF